MNQVATRTQQPKLQQLHRYAFQFLTGFTLFSWFCYLAFVKNPSNLNFHPWFPAIFSASFKVFAQSHVVLCFLVVALLLYRFAKWTWLRPLALAYSISLLAELGGTTIGIPFGLYEYSSLLGLKLFAHVPLLIPLSWFTVATCAYGISAHLFQSRWARLGFGALTVMTWDFTLDPAMTHMFQYWVWHTQGSWFYGMPWINFFGWFLTGLAILSAFEVSGFLDQVLKISLRNWILHYSLFISLGFGFVLLGGLWKAILLSAVAYVIVFVGYRLANPQKQTQLA